MYGEEIINRLHQESPLHNPHNPARKVLINTIGAWLDNFESSKIYENIFLESAEGKWLDLHGNDYGVYRNYEESDEHYRKRIVYETLSKLTVNYLRDVYDLETFYCTDDEFDPTENTLISNNPYLQQSGILIVASEDVQKILNKKFVIGSDVLWRTP